jgi:hypothetical protein
LFKLFKYTLEKYNIWLEDILNMDETGFQMGVLGKAKIVIPRADGNNYMQQSGDKSWASVLEATNGCRKILPPFLIFEGVTHQLQWYPRNTPLRWKFAIIENGWTTNDIALR